MNNLEFLWLIMNKKDIAVIFTLIGIEIGMITASIILGLK